MFTKFVRIFTIVTKIAVQRRQDDNRLDFIESNDLTVFKGMTISLLSFWKKCYGIANYLLDILNRSCNVLSHNAFAQTCITDRVSQLGETSWLDIIPVYLCSQGILESILSGIEVKPGLFLIGFTYNFN